MSDPAPLRLLGWCHNGYHTEAPDEVIRRARLAGLDALIIKYGDPEFEHAIADAGITWGVERFAYAAQPAREAKMLADAVDAGATFAVANCEPNDGGRWGDLIAEASIRTLIDAFRKRHATVPLYIAADLRSGRSHEAAFVREAARGGIDGYMALVYPKAFGQTVAEAFDAAYPGTRYMAHPCSPVIQTYGDVGADLVRRQVAEARRRGADSVSIYIIEAATDEELAAVAAENITPTVTDPAVLREVAAAYTRGAIAILDHGTPAELAAWGRLFANGGT